MLRSGINKIECIYLFWNREKFMDPCIPDQIYVTKIRSKRELINEK